MHDDRVDDPLARFLRHIQEARVHIQNQSLAFVAAIDSFGFPLPPGPKCGDDDSEYNDNDKNNQATAHLATP
jgi:hypothetical protein